jgi:peptide/nickel transport system substrate-binding protein
MFDRISVLTGSALTPLAICAAAMLLGCGGPEEGLAPGEGVAIRDEADAEESQAQEEGAPVRGDWLVLWSLADPESLNPITSNDSASNQVLTWIFRPLLEIDHETLEQRPLIARELPEIGKDKLTYTFRLRKGVTFSDGTPLTADDVIFTIKVIKHPKVNAPHARNYYESVRDVTKVDPLTVRFDLSRKYFRNDLVLGSTSPIPQHHYDPEGLLAGISVHDLTAFDDLDEARKDRATRFAKAFNEGFHRNPLGPGAFVLRNPEEDYTTGVRVVLHHRDDYWAPNDSRLGDAWVNRVLIRIINDREAALVALKNGDLDVIGMTPLQFRLNKNNPRFNRKIATKVHVSPGYTYIGWNQKKKIFQDARVRRALSYFVDKRNLVDKILHGLGLTVESPIFIQREEYNRNLETYTFDPEKGKALLAEAGWSDTNGDGVLDKKLDGELVDLSFEIITNSGNDIRRDVGLAVIDGLKRAGVNASFRALDWSIMLEQVKNFDFDAVILGWAMSVLVPDAYQVWHSSQAVPGGSNHVDYRNEEVDRILEEYRVEFDPKRRKQLYDRFQEILYKEQPYTFLFMQEAITAWDRRFHGVTWYPSSSTDYVEWWVPHGSQKYR